MSVISEIYPGEHVAVVYACFRPVWKLILLDLFLWNEVDQMGEYLVGWELRLAMEKSQVDGEERSSCPC